MRIWRYTAFFSLLYMLPLYNGNGVVLAQNTTGSAISTTGQTTKAAKPANKKPKAAAKEEKNMWTHGSLMFDSKTASWIDIAIKSYEKKISLEILLPSLFPPQGSVAIEEPAKEPEPTISEIITETIQQFQPPTEAPAYYLKTIMYFNPHNWTLWLNDKKMTDTADKQMGNITAVLVNKDQAVFTWKDSRIDLISPNWKNGFIPMDNEQYASPEKNIVVDANTGNISFILKPNQSFVSSPLQIVEGKATTTSLGAGQAITNASLSNGNPSPAPLTASPSPPAQEPETTKALEIPKNTLPGTAMDTIKNLETLKSVLDQTMQQLR